MMVERRLKKMGRIIMIRFFTTCMIATVLFVGTALAASDNNIRSESAGIKLINENSSYIVKIFAGQAVGTGFLFRDGSVWYIGTNAHVIKATRTFVWVQFRNVPGFQKARIVGRDELFDVALLEAPEVPLSVEPVKFGRSRELKIGDVVYAAGHPHGVWSVTEGVVNMMSAPPSPILARTARYYVGTQVPLHPGNSGGPLIKVESNGEQKIVAINTLIKTEGLLSLSLGIDYFKRMIPRLKTDRFVRHADAGLEVLDVDDVHPVTFEKITGRTYSPSTLESVCSKLFVVSVATNSPADDAGISDGDCIVALKVGDQEIEVSAQQFGDMIFFNNLPGQRFALKTTRSGQIFERTIVLEEAK